MQDSVNLKPCPFCGGEAKTHGPYGWYRQWCISHSCKAFYTGAQDAFKDYPSETSAIAAWNERLSTTPNVKGIQRRMKEARSARGMSLDAVAQAAGMSKSHIWELERGKASNPTVAAVWAISGALAVSPAWLLGLNPDAPPIDPIALEVAALINRRVAALRAEPPQQSTHQGEATNGGWVVMNAAGNKWRTFENGLPIWTEHLRKAIRYARRVDAEMAHRDDGEAWVIQPYVMAGAALTALGDRHGQ